MMARRAVQAGLRTKTQTFATLGMRGASVSGGALDLNITTAGGRSARAGAESGGRRQGRVEVGGARTGSCKLSVAVINPALNPGADVDEHADGAPTSAFQRESGAAMAWASRATKADFNPSADRLRLVNSALSSGTRIPGTSCSVYEGSGALRAGEGVVAERVKRLHAGVSPDGVGATTQSLFLQARPGRLGAAVTSSDSGVTALPPFTVGSARSGVVSGAAAAASESSRGAPAEWAKPSSRRSHGTGRGEHSRRRSLPPPLSTPQTVQRLSLCWPSRPGGGGGAALARGGTAVPSRWPSTPSSEGKPFTDIEGGAGAAAAPAAAPAESRRRESWASTSSLTASPWLCRWSVSHRSSSCCRPSRCGTLASWLSSLSAFRMPQG